MSYPYRLPPRPPDSWDAGGRPPPPRNDPYSGRGARRDYGQQIAVITIPAATHRRDDHYDRGPRRDYDDYHYGRRHRSRDYDDHYYGRGPGRRDYHDDYYGYGRPPPPPRRDYYDRDDHYYERGPPPRREYYDDRYGPRSGSGGGPRRDYYDDRYGPVPVPGSGPRRGYNDEPYGRDDRLPPRQGERGYDPARRGSYPEDDPQGRNLEEEEEELSFWDKYKCYIIIVIIGIVLLLILVAVLYCIQKGKFGNEWRIEWLFRKKATEQAIEENDKKEKNEKENN